jgi:hypothetical protein
MALCFQVVTNVLEEHTAIILMVEVLLPRRGKQYLPPKMLITTYQIRWYHNSGDYECVELAHVIV